MMEEVLDNLLSEGETYVDATFGSGGHTRAILEASDRTKVIGIDRDPNVITFANAVKEDFRERFDFTQARFSEIKSVINSQEVSGVFFDIGVSSTQIDDAERGFSFMRDGPLTMTMGKNDFSAYDVVNYYKEEDLANIILEYGEEKAAKKIAKAICSRRKISPITTTLELAEIVKSVVPKRGKIHPATLTFQAIRVFVNEELEELESGLKDAIDSIAVGGRVVVMTFQGLEDRIVKEVFKLQTKKLHTNKFKLQTDTNRKSFEWSIKSVLKPSRHEIRKNPRARSAKIRAIVRVA